jgi:hypothetical protein
MNRDVDIQDDPRPPVVELLTTAILGLLVVSFAIGGSLLTLKTRELFDDFGLEIPYFSGPWFRYPFLPALICLPSAALLIAAALPAESATNRRLLVLIAFVLLLLAAAAFIFAMALPLIKVFIDLS